MREIPLGTFMVKRLACKIRESLIKGRNPCTGAAEYLENNFPRLKSSANVTKFSFQRYEEIV